jgi:hypothetical protein
MKYLKDAWFYIRPKTEREMVEAWLAKSGSLEELERRQKAILNPRLSLLNPNLKGWV